MPLALTCTCGVHLEIDDKFAGQIVNCPDCGRAVQVPRTEASGRQTSGLALASIILALVGAFTVIGTVLAVLVGVLALRQLSRRPGRLAGQAYAVAGITIGSIMTVGTILAASSFEVFGWTALLTDVNWSGKLEYGGPLEVVRPTEGFAITRPSTSWGVYKSLSGHGAGDFNFSTWDDTLLVLPGQNAVVLCYLARVSPDSTLASCKDRFVRDFRYMDKLGLFASSGRASRAGTSINVVQTEWLGAKDGVDSVELLVDKKVAADEKRFLVRLHKPAADDLMYVVIAGVRQTHFHRLQAQFREAHESFRLLPRTPRRER